MEENSSVPCEVSFFISLDSQDPGIFDSLDFSLDFSLGLSFQWSYYVHFNCFMRVQIVKWPPIRCIAGIYQRDWP